MLPQVGNKTNIVCQDYDRHGWDAEFRDET